jgi:preprotein translocase subunit SecD
MNAQPSQDSTGRSAIGFCLNRKGGRKFCAFNSGHGKEKTVSESFSTTIFDNEVQPVATIDKPIRDQDMIRGRFTLPQVQELEL